MRWRAALLLLAFLMPVHGVAQEDGLAPDISLRPEARPGDDPVAEAIAEELAQPETETETPTRQPGILGSLFQPRPGAAGVATAPTIISANGSALAVASSLRPGPRPEGLENRVREIATRNTPSTVTRPGQSSGQLCGVIGLQGEQIEPVTGRISGCGIPSAIRLRVVHGVQLTTPATINCTTAQSLSQWVLDADEIIGGTGGGMANLRVVASYACRTRNSQSGARLSEHATGNAIDIAGIGLQNGGELSVLDDWRSGNSGIMRGLHEAACGTFGTVLGPNSDRFHQDHFHFDVASYRSGAYCR